MPGAAINVRKKGPRNNGRNTRQLTLAPGGVSQATISGCVVSGHGRQINNISIASSETEKELFIKQLTQHFGDVTSRAYHEDIRVPGSWEAFLQEEEMRAWMEKEGSRLWCYGDPGAGKTVLCSAIVDYLEEKRQVEETKTPESGASLHVAWIYCRYSERKAQSIKKLCQSLLRQLCESAYYERSKTRESIEKLVNKFISDNRRGTGDYFKLLDQLVQKPGKWAIIIDAMDECAQVDPSGCSRDFLIQKLSALPKSCKLLILSRKSSDLENAFVASGHWNMVQVQPNEDEVRSYIKKRLHPDPDTNMLSRTFRGALDSYQNEYKEDLRFKIEDIIFRNYKRVFNLVRLQLNSIVCFDDFEDVLNALRSFPTGEDRVYSQTIQRIRESKYHKIGLHTLQWIYATRRPLRKQELLHAVAYSGSLPKTPEHDRIVDSCQGLVVYFDHMQTFDFSHPSLREYLDNPTTPDDVEDFSIKNVNNLIAKICIQTLVLCAKVHQSIFEQGLSEYAKEFWYCHIIDKESAQRLQNDWAPLVLQIQGDSSGAYKQWTKCSGTILKHPVEIACTFQIEWLLGFLTDLYITGTTRHWNLFRRNGIISEDSSINMEDEILIFVARLWPAKFVELLKLCLKRNPQPTPRLLEAIVVAENRLDRSDFTFRGTAFLQETFKKYPDFRITEAMLIAAAGSSQAEDMLQIMFQQIKCNINERTPKSLLASGLDEGRLFKLNIAVGVQILALALSPTEYTSLVFTLPMLYHSYSSITEQLRSLWHRRNERRGNGEVEPTDSLVSYAYNDPIIFYSAASNPFFNHPTNLLWLIDNLDIALNEEISYILAERSLATGFFHKHVRQNKKNVDAGKLLHRVINAAPRQSDSVPEDNFLDRFPSTPSTWMYNNSTHHHGSKLDPRLHRLLRGIQNIATIQINPWLIHALGELHRTKQELESELLSYIVGAQPVITKEAGRCLARHFNDNTIILFIKSDTATLDVALSVLEELYRLTSPEYNYGENRCIPSRCKSDDLKDKLVLERERDASDFFASRYPCWETQVSFQMHTRDSSYMRRNALIWKLLRYLPDDLSIEAVDQAIQQSEGTLLHVILRVLGYSSTSASSLDAPSHKTWNPRTNSNQDDTFHDMFFQDIGATMINILMKRMDTIDLLVSQIISRDPKMEYLCGGQPVDNIQIDIDSSKSLMRIIARLCLMHLLVDAPYQSNIINELYQLFVQYYRYLPEGIRDMEQVPAGVYIAAVSNTDRRWRDALEGILKTDEGWIPRAEHFNAAVRNENAAYEIFEVLKERADRYGAEVLEPDLLRAALSNQSENCLVMFEYILELYKNVESFPDPDLNGIEPLIQQKGDKDMRDLLFEILKEWKRKRKVQRDQIDRMIVLGDDWN